MADRGPVAFTIYVECHDQFVEGTARSLGEFAKVLFGDATVVIDRGARPSFGPSYVPPPAFQEDDE